VATNYGSGNVRVATAAGTSIASGSSGIVAINKAPSSGSFVVPSASEASVLAFGTIVSGTIPTATVANDPAAGILAGYNPANEYGQQQYPRQRFDRRLREHHGSGRH
jgi:hypothetical protein